MLLSKGHYLKAGRQCVCSPRPALLRQDGRQCWSHMAKHSSSAPGGSKQLLRASLCTKFLLSTEGALAPGGRHLSQAWPAPAASSRHTAASLHTDHPHSSIPTEGASALMMDHKLSSPSYLHSHEVRTAQLSTECHFLQKVLAPSASSQLSPHP